MSHLIQILKISPVDPKQLTASWIELSIKSDLLHHYNMKQMLNYSLFNLNVELELKIYNALFVCLIVNENVDLVLE